jgi:hypothetical protein
VTVGGTAVLDPASYLALYSLGKPVFVAGRGDPQEIVLRSLRPSPWTDEDVTIQFYRRPGVIVFAATTLVLPREVVDRIAARESLR